jgi:AraC-like DNA-binding protein
MRDLISETLRKYAHKSKVDIKALQRYFKMKFSLSIDEDVISRRLNFMRKQAA